MLRKKTKSKWRRTTKSIKAGETSPDCNLGSTKDVFSEVNPAHMGRNPGTLFYSVALTKLKTFSLSCRTRSPRWSSRRSRGCPLQSDTWRFTPPFSRPGKSSQSWRKPEGHWKWPCKDRCRIAESQEFLSFTSPTSEPQGEWREEMFDLQFLRRWRQPEASSGGQYRVSCPFRSFVWEIQHFIINVIINEKSPIVHNSRDVWSDLTESLILV